jgi:hypothetical protein
MAIIHDRLLRTLPIAALAGTAMSLTLLAAAPAHATPPTISCIGGISTGTACICRQPTVQVQTGPSSFRCVMGDLTSVPPAGPFGLRDRVHAHPQIMVGPAGHGFGRPTLQPMGRQSSLPVGRPMMVR